MFVQPLNFKLKVISSLGVNRKRMDFPRTIIRSFSNIIGGGLPPKLPLLLPAPNINVKEIPGGPSGIRDVLALR